MTEKKESVHEDFLEGVSQFADQSASQEFLEGLSEYSTLQNSPDRAVRVGERVKQIREEKGLTLNDLASRTGFEVPMLEQIENDMISPPLGVLVKLSKAMDMKLGYLISAGESKPYQIVRKQDRKPISRYASKKGVRYGYAYESLAPQKRDRTMEPFLVTLEPADQEPELSSHNGEEFIFVLQGEMEVRLGEDTQILYPGDCVYYESTIPHLVKTRGSQITRILAVLTTGNQ
jgi:transcriptional regulator with XRE-family HTH domain